MTIPDSEKRMTYIDVTKGIAMVLVVMHHCGGSLDRGMEILTMVDVPLFFLCSGYLAYKQTINYKREIKKKTMGLLVPFVFLLFLMSYLRKESIARIFITDITKSGYWFLEALYLIFLLFYAIRAVCGKRSMQILLWGGVEVFLLATAKFLPETVDNILCLSSLARYFPCFIMGVVIREYEIGCLNRYFGFILIVLSILGFSSISDSNNINFLLCIGAYCSSAVIFFYFIKSFESDIPGRIHKLLECFGKYSLSIYIIHFFLVPVIPSFLPSSFVFNLIYSLLMAIIISYLSFLIGRFLSYTTPLNNILK